MGPYRCVSENCGRRTDNDSHLCDQCEQDDPDLDDEPDDPDATPIVVDPDEPLKPVPPTPPEPETEARCARCGRPWGVKIVGTITVTCGACLAKPKGKTNGN